MKNLDAAEILQKLKDKNLHVKLMSEAREEQGEIYAAYRDTYGFPFLPMPTDEFYVMWEDKIVFIGSRAGLYTFVNSHF